MADRGGRPQVLFVDDEENVLHGLARQVHGFVKPKLATSPVEAARLLEEAGANGGGYAVVVSDMRMPQMDGAALLKHARVVCPEATRILLTGYTDINSAISAVNDGAVFRFLTKPCATTQLRSALTDALEQHQLVRDQRELLELTLRGAVAALVETLSMANPAAFTRASRLGRLTRSVADGLGLPDAWLVEVAAQLGEIGVVTLPPEALDALVRGTPTDLTVAHMLADLPRLADDVLRRIPRLDGVREIIRAQEPVDSAEPARLVKAPPEARLVQAVREYDALTARGHAAETALAMLRQRQYHPAEMLAALQAAVSGNSSVEVREVEVAELHEGLVLAADLRSSKGLLLVGAGQELTDQLLARIRNYSALSGLESKPVISAGP